MPKVDPKIYLQAHREHLSQANSIESVLSLQQLHSFALLALLALFDPEDHGLGASDQFASRSLEVHLQIQARVRVHLTPINTMEPAQHPHIPNPPSYACTCSANQGSSGKGLVLLFYRYWANDPPLPASSRSSSSPSAAAISDLTSLASWHRALTAQHQLSGKIRIAPEGFNATVAGTASAIASYIIACKSPLEFRWA